MEKVLELVKKQISEIETEISRGILKTNQSVKVSRRGKIQIMLMLLSSFERDSRTTEEEANLIWRYREQLKTYLNQYYKN